MDLGIVIAIVGSTVAIIGVVISLMFWARQEINGVREELHEDRKDFLQILRSLETTITAIRIENKDFHYRLLEIERKRNID